MKKFARLMLLTALVCVFMAVQVLIVNAANFIDPNTLKVRDNVVFVMDPDESGKLEGDGSGANADNPLKPTFHEDFDPDEVTPKHYLQTALYQATEKLKVTGGTVVICGQVKLGLEQTCGDSDDERDFITANFGTNTIKFTSVYDGVDYRKKNGAKLSIESPAMLIVKGQSIWENIDIETLSTDRVISFHSFSTLIGADVNCYPADKDKAGIASNYISLSGGHRYEGGVDLATNLVVKSGSYNVITSAIWGEGNNRSVNYNGSINWTYNNDGDTNANLTLDGETTVYGEIIGTTKEYSEFSGNTTITINGGTYNCDIVGVGETGMKNFDGKVIIKINGGDFSKLWSIKDRADLHENNPPELSLLDFSGWTGGISGIAQVIRCAGGFTSFKYPLGITQYDVEMAIKQLDTPQNNETTTQSTMAESEVVDAFESETDVDNSVNGGRPMGAENVRNIKVLWMVVVGIALVAVALGVASFVLMKKQSKK